MNDKVTLPKIALFLVVIGLWIEIPRLGGSGTFLDKGLGTFSSELRFNAISLAGTATVVPESQLGIESALTTIQLGFTSLEVLLCGAIN